MSSDIIKRRDFLKKISVFGGALLISPLLTAESLSHSKKNKPEVEQVSPNEDLMREHGALRRILLIYREAIRRIEAKENLDPHLINQSATIIRNFIENYHEKLEEHFLFPKFEKAGKLTDLINTLKVQHQVGRKLTDNILEVSRAKNFKSHSHEFVMVSSKFIDMYEPHAAREDTVLFPALHEIVSVNEYNEMGEQFEDEEHRLFGKEGFEGIISQIADIEKKLGIYALSNFTPN